MMKANKILTILVIIVISITIIVPAYADWGPEIMLANGTSQQRIMNYGYPLIAVSGNNIHVIFMINGYMLYYKRSIDGGITWSPDIRLTSDQDCKLPYITVSGKMIHLIWVDEFKSGRDVHYMRSLDGGETWDSDTILVLDELFCTVAIAANVNDVHVAWISISDQQIHYKHSSDCGTSWSEEIKFPQKMTMPYPSPSLTVSGNDVYIVGSDESNGNIYLLRSTDRGANWSPGKGVISFFKGESTRTWLTASDDMVGIFWQVQDRGIHFIRSTDNGVTWGKEIILAGDSSEDHDIATSNNNLVVVWKDVLPPVNTPIITVPGGWVDKAGVHCIRSKDGGITWDDEFRLSHDQSRSIYPHVAVSDENIYVVWEEFLKASSLGGSAIYFRSYTLVPAIFAMNPTRMEQGQTMDNVSIIGTNFNNIKTIDFGDGITVNSYQADNATKITASITASPQATPGLRNISVITSEGKATGNYFAVTEAQKTDDNKIDLTWLILVLLSLLTLLICSAAIISYRRRSQLGRHS